MVDTDMPGFEYIEEFGHINLGLIDSILNDDDRRELRRHFSLFGIADDTAESLIEEIDTILKKETARHIKAVTTPSASEARTDIKKLLKASSAFLRLYWEVRNYSDHLVGMELERNNSPKTQSIIEGVEALKEACEAALINLHGPNRKKTTKTGFFAVKTDDGIAAVRAQNIAPAILKNMSPLIPEDTETVPHDFTPVMRDVARVWYSATGITLSRSRNRVGSGDISPVYFVHYVLSKVHNGMDEDRAERLIRDYEEALRSAVNDPLRRNEAS